MAEEDDFEPKLGRPKSRGGKQARRYLGRILAAANLAGGGARANGGRLAGYSGARHGRGAGVGRLLSAPGGRALGGRRRVVIKASIVRLAGKGAGAAAAHLRYLQRDGTTREGDGGKLYGRDSDDIDRAAFRERGAEDRHQFRFIVSAEDGADYEDLKPLTRRLMEQVEHDLGTSLDWVAVDHFNTGHPHTHIVVRGKDDRGADLVIAKDYLTVGLRERAIELVDLDLGPRSQHEVETTLRAEMTQERLTSIDRALLRGMAADREVQVGGRTVFDQALRAGRLSKLAKLGLAEPLGGGRWRLAERLDDTLRRMGERGDIIRTLQREIGAAGLDRPAADRVIYTLDAPDAAPVVGRVVVRGLADEHADRHYLVIDGTDGRAHYVPLGRGGNLEALPDGAVVRVTPLRASVRGADRTIAAVAAANGGRYDVDAHLRHDPTATQDYAESHVRRLEAMRWVGAGVERNPSGVWSVSDDHLERVERWEAARIRAQPVAVEILSRLPVKRLVDREAATWLDREAVADAPTPLRDAGFGREMREAMERRRQWIMEQELGDDREGTMAYRPDALARLQRREVQRVAAQLADDLGKPVGEAVLGGRVDGVMRRSVDLVSGRFALVERSRDFVLVPWRPVLELQIGKPVSGLVREGSVSWTIGRGRGGPSR